MQDIKCVIFDMDGVLVNSERAMAQASIDTLKNYGLHAAPEDFRDFIGMGEDMFIGGVARKHGGVYEEKMKDEAYQVYGEHAAERVQVFASAKPLIEKLHGRGYTLAVASAADRVKVNINLNCIGVKPEMFHAIVSGSDVIKKKPDPEIFLKASECVGVPPEACVVIEDAVSGTQAAKAAGMTAIAVTSSFDRETLFKAGADFVVDDIIGVLILLNVR